MLPTIVMTLGQILFLTITIFQLLVGKYSAAKTLVSMLGWILVVQPVSCFFVILLGLAVGMHAPHRRSRCCHLPPKGLSFVYWVSAATIFGSFSVSPAWIGTTSGGGYWDPIEDNLTFLLIHIPVVAGVMLFYCITCCFTVRSPANNDEEQMELNTN